MRIMIRRWISLVLITTGGLIGAATAGAKTFATADQARDALVQAAAISVEAVRDVLGPDATGVVRTGDQVEDQALLDRFNRQAAEKTKVQIDPKNANRATLLLGAEEWPFAIPLVRKSGLWSFDVKEGSVEVRRRVIGRNELDAIEICRGYVEAQQEYVETDWDRNGVPQYASKIVSTPGKKDGLYWPGEDSPVAEGFAKAVAEGYGAPTGTGTAPYHGYFFKILTAQGPKAPGGEQDYLVHNLMIGGFALVAWPAEYGVSGLMTFIVNQDGVVYEKNLGPQTSTLAKAMTKFNPEPSWRKSP
jgi:hypothetical protein